MIIYILGSMGSGKSTLGKPLAKMMGYKFIDLDDYIEECEGKKIHQIFEEMGETAFRQIERKALIDTSKSEGDYVISTGGGTPCKGDNMEIMNDSGLTIYLKLDSGVLASRLVKAKRVRPLLAGLDLEGIRAKIDSLLIDREPFYSKAHITVEGFCLSTKDLHTIISTYQETKDYAKHI